MASSRDTVEFNRKNMFHVNKTISGEKLFAFVAIGKRLYLICVVIMGYYNVMLYGSPGHLDRNVHLLQFRPELHELVCQFGLGLPDLLAGANMVQLTQVNAGRHFDSEPWDTEVTLSIQGTT